jgi:hypothetical protein
VARLVAPADRAEQRRSGITFARRAGDGVRTRGRRGRASRARRAQGPIVPRGASPLRTDTNWKYAGRLRRSHDPAAIRFIYGPVSGNQAARWRAQNP